MISFIFQNYQGCFWWQKSTSIFFQKLKKVCRGGLNTGLRGGNCFQVFEGTRTSFRENRKLHRFKHFMDLKSTFCWVRLTQTRIRWGGGRAATLWGCSTHIWNCNKQPAHEVAPTSPCGRKMVERPCHAQIFLTFKYLVENRAKSG